MRTVRDRQHRLRQEQRKLRETGSSRDCSKRDTETQVRFFEESRAVGGRSCEPQVGTGSSKSARRKDRQRQRGKEAAFGSVGVVPTETVTVASDAVESSMVPVALLAIRATSGCL